MVIYADILIILNLFVDYFLLRSCGILLNTKLKKKRLIFGALVGSFFSLLILLPSLNVLLNLIIKIITGVLLVLIVFGFKTKQLFFKTVSIFLAENLIFVGVMFFVWVFLAPPGMFWKNGVTYVSISPVVLVLGSLMAYFLTSIFNFVLEKRVNVKKIYSVEIGFNGRKIVLNALYDSGNCLIEPFSKKPVCVCEYESLIKILPEELINFFNDFFNGVENISSLNFKKSIKLIPCDTISSSLILPAFLPESFNILNVNGENKEFKCYVAVTKKKISDGEFAAILGEFN